MAKKKKEISLDDLEEELDVEESQEEFETKEEIEEIEEFSLDEISEKEEISEIFEETVEEAEEIIDERIYIIPLAKARKGPRTKWAKKSIRYLREFITRHFKPESLVISQEVNERIWEKGIQKPPRKLKVRVTKNIDGLCVVYLA